MDNEQSDGRQLEVGRRTADSSRKLEVGRRTVFKSQTADSRKSDGGQSEFDSDGGQSDVRQFIAGSRTGG